MFQAKFGGIFYITWFIKYRDFQNFSKWFPYFSVMFEIVASSAADEAFAGHVFFCLPL